MHKLVVGLTGHQRTDFDASFSLDAFDIFGIVVGQSAGNDPQVRSGDRDRITGFEAPDHLHHARREQAAVFFDQCTNGAVIDDDRPGGSGGADPAAADDLRSRLAGTNSVPMCSP